MKYPDNLKEELYNQCLSFVDQRIENAKQALQHAQDAANAEEKSSAGDKYETGRAMAHLEREKSLQQLNEALKLKAVLDRINPTVSNDHGTVGSVVITNVGNFYLTISAGELEVAGIQFIALSQISPIGALLMNKKKGGQFIFNKRSIEILNIL
jgi:hypothetical protein